MSVCATRKEPAAQVSVSAYIVEHNQEVPPAYVACPKSNTNGMPGIQLSTGTCERSSAHAPRASPLMLRSTPVLCPCD